MKRALLFSLLVALALLSTASAPNADASCGTCQELRRECIFSCAEAGCIMYNSPCNSANPCAFVCNCFCN